MTLFLVSLVAYVIALTVVIVYGAYVDAGA